MKRVSYDRIADLASGASFERTSGGGNGRQLEYARELVQRIIQEQLTQRQRQMVMLYFYRRLSMAQIAETLEVNKSTVSRTISRALGKVGERMRYYRFRG